MVDNKQNTKTAPKRLSGFEEYLYVNLLWWVFLAVLAVIAYFTCGAVWDDVTSGVMEFIFVIMGGGFALVSALDFFYENLTARPSMEGKK